jgi:hypothetical protein
MNAPPGKLSPEEFNDFIDKHKEEHYEDKGEGLVCKKCGLPVLQTTCVVSIHDKMFPDQCAGSGKVQRILLSYCLKCEGEPTVTSTCVHI